MHFWRQRMKGQASSVLDQEPAKGPPPRGSPSPRKFAFKKSPRRESREAAESSPLQRDAEQARLVQEALRRKKSGPAKRGPTTERSR